MTFRKVLFWLHLPAGLIGGIAILTMSVTGVLLTYERQITRWADREFSSLPPAGAVRVPVERLIEEARGSLKATPATVTIRAERSAPVEAGFGRERTVYLNPYTGAVMGEGSKGIREFFRSVTDWHRWLAVNGPGRPTGRAITGAANLLFLFLVVSGLYLWMPKKWSMQHLKAITVFRGGLSGKARDFNWHNVIGFWVCLPLFFIVLTGVVMSYPWANDLLYRLTRSTPPQPARGPGGSPAMEAPVAGLDALWTIAERKMPGWQSISLRIPASERAPVVFTLDRGNGGQPEKRATLTLNRSTGEIAKWETFEDFNLGRRLRSWGRFLHTGEALGVVGQTVAGLSSMGGAFLVWTGFALAWRRFRAWQGKATLGIFTTRVKLRS